MTSDERWEQNFVQLMQFMETNHRRPSKHRVEEHQMLNWLKFNKRCYANDSLPHHRRERFEQFWAMAGEVQRINQYAYVSK